MQLVDKLIDRATIDANDAPWLKSIREKGLAQFNTLGIPSTKDEDWRYTNLRALSAKQYSLSAGDGSVDTSLLSKANENHRLVFINGALDAKHSDKADLPVGVSVMSMQTALTQHPDKLKAALAQPVTDEPNAFAELNLGLFLDGAFIHIADGTHLSQTIELVFLNQGERSLSLPRNLILIGEDASAGVIERQISDDVSTCLSNSATQIILGERAKLDYHLIQLHGNKASHIGGTWIQQAAGSQLNTHTITLGGQLVRNELKVALNGEAAKANCTGVYFGQQRQHIDNHTTIHHTAPSCTSRELYKGILDDRARGVFHGRIKVDKIAQLTMSEQENQNLLLSRDAEVDTKPQLEIYADDVKCAHGATVGELDHKALFYMQSRGIDRASARKLLTYAFAAQVIEGISNEALREELTARIAEQMKMS